MLLTAENLDEEVAILGRDGTMYCGELKSFDQVRKAMNIKPVQFICIYDNDYYLIIDEYFYVTFSTSSQNLLEFL